MQDHAISQCILSVGDCIPADRLLRLGRSRRARAGHRDGDTAVVGGRITESQGLADEQGFLVWVIDWVR